MNRNTIRLKHFQTPRPSAQRWTAPSQLQPERCDLLPALLIRRNAIIQHRTIASSSKKPASATFGGRTFDELKESIAQDVRSMKRPSELFFHMVHSWSLKAAVTIAVEAGLFRYLAASPSSHTASELAQGLTSASKDPQDALEQEEFITRLMRALSGMKLVDETGQSTYQANELTHAFADSGLSQGWIYLHNNLIGPQSTLAQTALWAKENGYKAPISSVDGPFQRARNAVGTPSFVYYNEKDPTSMSQLSAFMQSLQKDRLNWSAWLPADAIFGTDSGADISPEGRVFMVDVGGGLGHDLNSFAARYPERKMRLVLQDQPPVIAEAKIGKLDPRIEMIDHDFFTPQPVKNAKIYFMHQIIHDWPDAECVQILTQLKDAMAADSRLFLNDAIVPNQQSPLIFSAIDFSMLALLSAKERSEEMWERLIESVGGLRVRKFWHAPVPQGVGVVEVVKA